MRANRKLLLRLLIAVPVVLAVIVSIFFKSAVFGESDEALYVAAVGPMSGPDQSSGREMVRGITLCLDQVNRAGGINGKPVKLLAFDDQDSPELAGQRALEIADQKKALVVLGHLFSSTSAKGGEVYKQYGIPAITGSATAEGITQENDWYFRTIFTNRSQAAYLASYARLILKQSAASIIHDEDDYGASLAETFDTTFTALGGTVKHTWRFDSQAEDLGQALDGIENGLRRAKTEGPGMIFLAAHEQEAEKILVSIKRLGLADLVVATDTVGDDSFVARFSGYPEEKAHPGYFTDGIYATSPMIFDVAGETAQWVRSTYTAAYGQDPGWTVTAYYDAALVAVDAMRMAAVRGDPTRLTEERKSVRDSLAAIDGARQAIEGAAGPIRFDDRENSIGSMYMGSFTGGRFVSAMVQLQPVSNPQSIADLQQEMQSGRILLVDGQYRYRTSVIYAGVDLNQVANLDTRSSTYTMDFYLWFRYQGQLDVSSVDFDNAEKEVTLGTPIVEETVGDITYRLYRVKASFRGNFLFHDYPFDRQQLAVRFRPTNQTRNDVIFAVDRTGMRDISSQALLRKWDAAGAFTSLGFWHAAWAGLFPDVEENDSGLGNPRLLGMDAGMDASRFNLVVWIQRDALDFIIKNLVPVFIVLGVSYLVFFLPTKELGTRIGIGTSTLLTTAFFDLNLGSHLPDIGYVVAIEYFFYVVYLLAVFGIVVTISAFIDAKTELKSEKEAAIKRLNLAGKVVYPVVLAITFAAYVYYYRLIMLVPPR